MNDETKELAIAFANWIGEQHLFCLLRADGERRWYKLAFLATENWSAEQLFNQFLQKIKQPDK